MTPAKTVPKIGASQKPYNLRARPALPKYCIPVLRAELTHALVTGILKLIYGIYIILKNSFA
jgi:hypothetical protein